MSAYSCQHSSGEEELCRYLGYAVSQPSPLDKLWTNEKLPLIKNQQTIYEEQQQRLTSGLNKHAYSRVYICAYRHTCTHIHDHTQKYYLKRGSEIQQGFAFILMFKNVLQVCSATVHKCERSLKVFLSVEDLSPTPDMTSFLT